MTNYIQSEFIEIPYREIRLGSRNYSMYELSSKLPAAATKESLVSLLTQIVSQGAIGIVLGKVADYDKSILSHDYLLAKSLKGTKLSGESLREEVKISDDDMIELLSDVLDTKRLAASIPDSMVMKLSDESLRKELNTEHKSGFFVGTKSLGRYLLARTGIPFSSCSTYTELVSTVELQKHKHLWQSSFDSEQWFSSATDYEKGEFYVMQGLAKQLAKMHSLGWLHGDLHPGNFGLVNNGKVYIWDLSTTVQLLRSLNTAECATDIAPLLHYISVSSWNAFKVSYMYEFGEMGAFTINYIEHGDEQRELIYFRRGEYTRLLNLYKEKLLECEQGGQRDLNYIYSNMAICYSRLGKHDEAIELLEKTKDGIDSKNTIKVLEYHHNLGMAYYRMKKHHDAITYLAQVTQLSENKKNIRPQINDCGLSMHLAIAKPDVVKTYTIA